MNTILGYVVKCCSSFPLGSVRFPAHYVHAARNAQGKLKLYFATYSSVEGIGKSAICTY